MRNLSPKPLAIVAALVASSIAALAANTVFFTNTGDLTFPFKAPTASAPGLIDNMTIGATTPQAGNFTTLKSTDGMTCVSYNQVLTAAIGDSTIFIATRPYILVSASQVHAIAAGGASLVQLVKDTGTAAPGAGTDLLTNNTNTGFNLNATANTVQVGTLVAASTRTLAAGDRLSVDFSAAIQASSGISITACLAPQ
ncbi:hypothetical protein LJR220_003339 [Bradyrhizobium sp. LjRoot220]|uniref:hypothetical protein n=1 Tax=Bradyrhizobium sp. LjRoot220 TaxID=3342284 RepID=UPI003ED144B0